MTSRKGIQLCLLVASIAAAVSAGSAKLAYPWLPSIIPLCFAWLSGAFWAGVFVFSVGGEKDQSQ